MGPDEYQVMADMETIHWWFLARMELVDRLMGMVIDRYLTLDRTPPRDDLVGSSPRGLKILDLGCGTGSVLESLGRFGDAVGVDISPQALSLSRRRGLRRLVLGSGDKLPFKDGSFDAVVALDCFEHIQDDMAALSESYRVLRPGGVLLTHVPAIGFLWSEHDEALHHRRRYSRLELRDKLTYAGFLLPFLTYSQCLLFPLILMFRVFSCFSKRGILPRANVHRVWSPLNRLLLYINRLDHVLAANLGCPVGVSLVSVATKTTGGTT